MRLHDKHRERLDKKVRTYGLEMLEAHEQLEHLLFMIIPRGDTNAIAHRLLERFISLAGVFNADVDELTQIEGVGKRTANFLTTLPSLLGIVERSVGVDAPPQFMNYEDVKHFVRTYFYGKLVEESYLFCLNSSYRLLGVSKVSAAGVGSEATIYPEIVLRQAILDRAKVVIVVHNHPCGDVNPSIADIELTRELFAAFNAIKIEFADSIVVSGKEVFSMREMGYLDKFCEKYER